MSFRMTHDSFGPWRDSTVCVFLPNGSIVRYENEANRITGRNTRWKPVSEENKSRIVDKFPPKYEEFNRPTLKREKKMCEIVKGQRRTFRDQDPPRICNRSNDDLKSELEFSKSTSNSSTILQRASSFEKCFSEQEFIEKEQRYRKKEKGNLTTQESTSSDSIRDSSDSVKAFGTKEQSDFPNRAKSESFLKELCDKVPSSGNHGNKVITNGLKSETDSCDGLTNGKKMAPVLGVPPPPPPAPHMGPDGLILPRKPYNPYLTSSNHKDLRRELLFNQKVGKNVLNQKSELQRALEKQREAASRREAQRNREENFKEDPRTALQRAIEQRARHIEMALEQSQPTTESNNPLETARAKLRSRTDSQ